MGEKTGELDRLANEFILISPELDSGTVEDLLTSTGERRVCFIQWLLLKRHPELESYFSNDSSSKMSQLQNFLLGIGLYSQDYIGLIPSVGTNTKQNINFWRKLLYYCATAEPFVTNVSSVDIAQKYLTMKNKKRDKLMPFDIARYIEKQEASSEVLQTIYNDLNGENTNHICYLCHDLVNKDIGVMKDEVKALSSKVGMQMNHLTNEFTKELNTHDLPSTFNAECLLQMKESCREVVTAAKILREFMDASPRLQETLKNCDELSAKMNSDKNVANSEFLSSFASNFE